MIEAIGTHNARYSITVAQNAKVKAAVEAIEDHAWQAIAYTRGGRPKWLRPPSNPAAAATGCATASPPSCGSSCAAPVEASCGGATTAHQPSRPRHRRPDAYHRGHATVELDQRPQRKLRSAAAPPTAPGRLLRARGRPPRRRAQLTVAATISTAPHSARQPQRPPQAPPAAQLAMGHGLHHSASATAHLSGAQRPAQRSRTPRATNPPQPPPPATHAPELACPPPHTSPAPTSPTPAPSTSPPVDPG